MDGGWFQQRSRHYSFEIEIKVGGRGTKRTLDDGLPPTDSTGMFTAARRTVDGAAHLIAAPRAATPRHGGGGGSGVPSQGHSLTEKKRGSGMETTRLAYNCDFPCWVVTAVVGRWVKRYVGYITTIHSLFMSCTLYPAGGVARTPFGFDFLFSEKPFS